MRKLSTLVFLLLILMYLGSHASCYHREADTSATAVIEQMAEPGWVALLPIHGKTQFWLFYHPYRNKTVTRTEVMSDYLAKERNNDGTMLISLLSSDPMLLAKLLALLQAAMST